MLTIGWVREGLRVAGGFVTGICFLFCAPASIAELLFAGASAVLLGWTACAIVWRQLRKGKISIDLLMILGGGGAMLLGRVWEGLLLLFLFSLSHALESFAEWKTEQSLKFTGERFPEIAVRRSASGWEEIPLYEIQVGDELNVRAGEVIPVDGTVSEGESSVDESNLTGESLPIAKEKGSAVRSGTLNISGQLVFRAEATSEESTAQKIVELVYSARKEQSREQAFSDMIGQRYAGAVIVISLVAAFIWSMRGIPGAETLYSTLALLVVASPCALVISIPAAVLAAIARSAASGVIFRGGKALDGLGRVKHFCFDKTGTLTTGELTLQGAHSVDGKPVPMDMKILRAAASLEQGSTHPIARAFIRAAKQKQVSLSSAAELQVHPGLGIEGSVDGLRCRVGSRKFFQLPPLQESKGNLEAICQVGSEITGVEFSDAIRPEAAKVVEELKNLGCRSVILSGDRLGSVENIARLAGIQEVHAALSPEQKLAMLRSIQAKYGAVAMVGEGLNDAPSLTGADVAVVMGGRGSGTALREAGVILMNDALGQLPFALRLSRKARAVIVQNLFISIGVAAALICFALNRELKLSLGVLGHEGSTVIVVLNSLRLLRLEGGMRSREN